MLLLGVKTYPALLWRICVLFAVESLASPTSQPSSSTVEDFTVLEKELQPSTWNPTQKPAEVSVAAATDNAGLPTVKTQEASSLNNSTVGLVVMSTAAETAATSGSDHRLLQTTKAETAAAGEDQLLKSTTITDMHAQDQFHHPSATTSNDSTPPAATSAAFAATVVASSPQPTSIIEPEVNSQMSSTVSSQESTQISNQTLSSNVSSDESTQISNQNLSSTVSSHESTQISNQNLSSTVSSHESTQLPNQTLSSPSASTATTMTTNLTSEAAPVFNATSMPAATTEMSKTSTEPPSTAATVLTSTGAAGSTSMPTSVSTDPPNSTVSNSSAGVLIPRDPRRILVSTFKPAAVTTTAHRRATKSPSSAEPQPCITRSLVKNCLIVIATLAALATIFMVSTIVLCVKLSAKKYRVKNQQRGTEMMCISALLPEPSYTYTRQRNLVRNGVRVIPGNGGADSDDELGDNLTLSSFLPENDRYV